MTGNGEYVKLLRKENEASLQPPPENTISYVAPRLERIGKLGEIIRGNGSGGFDWQTNCTTAGKKADPHKKHCPQFFP